MRHVADLHHVAVAVGDRDVGEVRGFLHAPVRAQREIAQPLLHFSAGDLHVLRLQRGDELRCRQPDGVQLRGVDDDVDLPRASADDQNLSDAIERLEPAAKFLVGEFRDVADRRRSGKSDAEDRDGIGVDFLNDRRIGVLRQVAENRVDLVAHFLRGDIEILLQHEGDDDL